MIQGFVVRIDENITQYGKMYNIAMDDGKSYGVGKFPPKGISAGDYVKFEATQKPGSKFWNVAAGSLSKQDKPAGVAVATPARSYGSKNDSFDARQTTISKQAALNSALTFTSLLVSAGALPIAKKDLTTDKAADAIHGVVDHYTDLFYKQSTGEDFPREDSVPSGLASAEAADTNWNE